MLLLYNDPKGETIGSTARVQPIAVYDNNIIQVNPISLTNTDLEEKVASLEKELIEREAQIAQLMDSKRSGKQMNLF